MTGSFQGEVVQRLCCRGGMVADSEFTPVVRRTASPATPSAPSSGWSQASTLRLIPGTGPITKTGNGHARRLLVEAAWHHRPRYQPGETIRDRWELATPAARARGDLGNRRLHARWVKYIDRKKKATVANTAIASELAGWCWPLALLEE